MNAISEVRSVTMGVRDLDRSLRFYRTALGYQLVERRRIDATLARWLRSESGGECALIGADDSGLGRLLLVASDEPGDALWTASNVLSASGYYALNFRARDLRSLLPTLLAAGGQGPAQPSHWEVSETIAVDDSITLDPDGHRLDIFTYTRGAELRGPLATDVSVLQTVALATRDLARSRRFYEALGFRPLFDRILDFDELSTLLGVAGPVRIHNVNLIKDGCIVPGRVEMFAYLDVDAGPEERLAARAHPPQIGIHAMTLHSHDLAGAESLLQHAGAQLQFRMALDLPGVGSCIGAVFAGPDGEAIEVVQPQGRTSPHN
jgi:catechol 2,3-dioxygenase-like lactoylglutathione lyase family enzyme